MGADFSFREVGWDLDALPQSPERNAGGFAVVSPLATPGARPDSSLTGRPGCAWRVMSQVRKDRQKMKKKVGELIEFTGRSLAWLGLSPLVSKEGGLLCRSSALVSKALCAVGLGGRPLWEMALLLLIGSGSLQNTAYGFLPTMTVIGDLGSIDAPHVMTPLIDLLGWNGSRGTNCLMDISNSFSATSAAPKLLAIARDGELDPVPNSTTIPVTGFEEKSVNTSGGGHLAPFHPTSASSISTLSPVASSPFEKVISCQASGGLILSILSLTLNLCSEDNLRSTILSLTANKCFSRDKLSVLSCSAFTAKDPIISPDSWFVFTRQISSAANAAISNSVDRFSRRSLLSFSPPVNHVVKLAMYSPMQATATSPLDIYSAISQHISVEVRDSDEVIVILNHMRKERIALMICIVSLLSLLAAHLCHGVYATLSARSSASRAATKAETSWGPRSDASSHSR
jgi:hypothetical protein